MPTRADLTASLVPVDDGRPVEWSVAAHPVDYDQAVATMEARVAAIIAGTASELVWLVEHPPLYTAGTSSRPTDLLTARFPVHQTGRGGQLTYHGPGQRVAYVMLDLKRRRPDVRAFVAALETWLLAALSTFNLKAGRREGRVGIWVDRLDKPPSPDGQIAEDKIAALGIRLRQWVSFHGVSLNVDPDLVHFHGIVPCGLAEPHFGVTSLVDLGYPVTMADVDVALRQTFEGVFGLTARTSGVAGSDAVEGGGEAETHARNGAGSQ